MIEHDKYHDNKLYKSTNEIIKVTGFLSSLRTIQHSPTFTKYSAINNLSSIPASDRCKAIFEETPVVAYRRSPNLRDLLVRAKLKSLNSPPSLPPGSFRCNSRHGCLTCPHIEDGNKSYTFTSTGETHDIKQTHNL